MDRRPRKRRRRADVSIDDDFIELESSQSEDVMCSQFVDDDPHADKSSSDVEILSDVSFSFFCYFLLESFLFFSCNLFSFPVGFIFWWLGS